MDLYSEFDEADPKDDLPEKCFPSREFPETASQEGNLSHFPPGHEFLPAHDWYRRTEDGGIAFPELCSS